jgi:hypothetical protein
MRRGYVLIAMTAMAIGGYAEAGLDIAVPDQPVLDGIHAFIAQQRRADMEACAARGAADIAVCARDLVGQRRARLQGKPVAPAAPAGTDI